MRRLLFKLLVIWLSLGMSRAAVALDKSPGDILDIHTLLSNVIADENPTDTVPDEEKADTTILYNVNPASFRFKVDTVSAKFIQATPSITVPQMVKGMASGVYVQETTGEPGSAHQYMYIRGLSRPLLGAKELFLSQPAVYVNGIPLIQDNPYIYNIQTYDLNPIGPSTNLLSIVDQDNIEKIDIVKDFKDAAQLGPRAANGAIYITTKNARPGEKLLSINGYTGYGLAPSVNTINAATEKNFRLPYYAKFGTAETREMLPGYLSDSSNADYYGASNWTDLYYKNVPLYNVNGSLTGGAGRSNFRAFFGTTQNANPADATGINRYTGSFYISMLPAKWMTVSSMVSGTLLNRKRNRNFSDRFAEMRYIPSTANPLPPSKNVYQRFVDVYEGDLIDDNQTTAVQGYFSVSAKLGKFVNTARLSFDYNEGKRDVFYPKILFSGNNYVSNYFGFNQRFILEDKIEYSHLFDNNSKLNLVGGLNYQGDISKYNYLAGYNGPDDVKRIAEVIGDKSNGQYLIHQGYFISGYLDQIQQRLMSFWGKASYQLANSLEVSVLLRSDGSSSVQPNKRWFVSPVFDARYDVVKQKSGFVSAMDLHASWGRIGDLLADGLIGVGPQYAPQMSWGGIPLTSFNGYSTFSRPYNTGWIGYDIPWSYVQQLNVGTNLSLFDNKISINLDVYNKDNKDMVLTVPAPAESGYEYEFKPGMWVNNKGVDATIGVNLVPAKENGFGWTAAINANYNENELKGLPEGASAIILNDRKLKVGEPVDAFWLLQNAGIYNSASEVPSGLTYKGLPFGAGDPIWVDVDENGVIDDDDKVLEGNAMPKLFGGFFNQFTYKNFDLSFLFQFATGHSVINQEAANYMDFITRDNADDLNGVKEITYWEDRIHTEDYPMYNPWSEVGAYQLQQDLYREKADYLSLRSVTIGYKFKGKNQLGFGQGKGIRDLYLYLTGTNLFKVSPYSNRDSELANYLGYDTGLSLPLVRSIIFGLKLNL